MKPRIAIPVPTSKDLAYNERSWPAYATAVERSGGEAVKIELGVDPTHLRQIFASCQGRCLTGSPADVAPGSYGAETDPLTSPADPDRELADRTLLEEAARHGKPVLGICFGIQMLNVWRGGSLVQHLTPMPVNHEAGSKVAVAHTILIPKDSLLAELTDAAELTTTAEDQTNGLQRLPVNTSHHQSVAAPGDGLRIVARCPEDAVIEAVEAPYDTAWDAEQHPATQRPQFFLGVQWHPERSYEISQTSRNLFTRLISEAGKVQADSQ